MGAVFVLLSSRKFKARSFSAFVFHLFSALHYLIGSQNGNLVYFGKHFTQLVNFLQITV